MKFNLTPQSSYANTSIASYSWNFGDSSTHGAGQKVTHRFARSGSYTITLTVRDRLGQTDIFTQTIRAKANTSPYFTQSSEVFVVHQGESTTLNLMAAQDAPSDSLTYTLVQAPSSGTLSGCLGGTADLTCTYLPNSSSTAGTQFTYKANDGTSDSEYAFTVFLHVKSPRSPIVQVTTGSYHTCALFQNKKVTCWGRNDSGQLGLGHTQAIGDDETPLMRDFVLLGDTEFIDLGEGALQISSGITHTCAVLESGGLRCWGYNRHGQLGVRAGQHVGDNERPATISTLNFGQKVLQVSALGSSTCVLLARGGVRCWGYNAKGELGLGHRNSIDNISSLSDLPLGQKAKMITGGNSHTCTVLMDDTLKCWGHNEFGKLGLGHRLNIGDNESLSALPIVHLPRKILNASSGSHSTCALFTNHKSLCWGHSDYHGGSYDYNIGETQTPFTFPSLAFGEGVKQIILRSYNQLCSTK